MNYLNKIFLVLFLTTLAFSHTAFAKTYVNGIDKAYPPFSYIGDDHIADGFDVKAMDWIAKEMGFKVIHHATYWDTIIDSLLAHEIDMICSGMAISEERLQRVRFTEPYWTFSKVFAAANNTNIKVEDIYNSSLKLGIQRGTSEHIELEQEKIYEHHKYRLYFYSSAPLALESLSYNRVDAVALNEYPARNAIANGMPIKIIGTFGDNASLGVAVRKSAEDDALFELINEGYRRLKQDPYWKELQKTYLR